MIKTVIFDIGGVLTVYDERGYYRSFGYDEEMVERLYNATMGSGHWFEFDLGNLTSEQILDIFKKKDPEIAEDIDRCLSDITHLVQRKDTAIPWIRKVKESGRKVLVLSNFSRQAFIECADALDFLPETDGGILSFREHVVKPMSEIYSLLIGRYNLKPQECVFIDDMPGNLEAASKFGIHTILYRTQEQAEKELDALLTGGGSENE